MKGLVKWMGVDNGFAGAGLGSKAVNASHQFRICGIQPSTAWRMGQIAATKTTSILAHAQTVNVGLLSIVIGPTCNYKNSEVYFANLEPNFEAINTSVSVNTFPKLAHLGMSSMSTPFTPYTYSEYLTTRLVDREKSLSYE